MKGFDQVIAIVTGGGSGIGRALCVELARRGARAVVVADVRADVARQAAAEIGASAEAATLDVTHAAAFADLASDVARRHGRIDLLFNNAGLGVFGPSRFHTTQDWTRTFDVNVGGVVNGIQAVMPLMRAQGFGHVVNTASIAGLLPATMLSAYCASKHAVVGLSQALRVEAARDGVRISALCPGVVQTPLLTGGAFGLARCALSGERLMRWWRRFTPWLTAEDLARQALDGVARNRALIVVPRTMRLLWRLYRISPALGLRIAAWDLDRSLQAYPELDQPAA